MYLFEMIKIFIISSLLLGMSACQVSEPGGKSFWMLPKLSMEGSFGKVDGREVSFENLDNSTRREIHALEHQLYQARVKAFDQWVAQYVLGKEAKARGLTVDELMSHDVFDANAALAAAKVQGFWKQNQGELEQSLETQFGPEWVERNQGSLRQIVGFSLEKEYRNAALQTYLQGLRKKSRIQTYLVEPPPLRISVPLENTEKRLARGRHLAKEGERVMLIEFGSYGDPITAKVDEMLKLLLWNKAIPFEWHFRHYPRLKNDSVTDALILKTHRSAVCAEEQEKFWDLHDLLVREGQDINTVVLPNLLKNAGINQKQFEQCMDKKSSLALVGEDREMAKRLDLDESPVYFINGIPINGREGPEVIKGWMQIEAKNTKYMRAQKVVSAPPKEKLAKVPL